MDRRDILVHVFVCFCTKPTRPGILIPGLASMVMPPLPTALTLPRREILERAKINAEYLEKTIKKCGCGKNGMALSKKEYKKEIKAEAVILLKDAYGNEIRQIGLLKAALLNLKHRPTRCLAMKYELENGYLLQRLLVNRDWKKPLKTVEEAVEMVEDFLWF